MQKACKKPDKLKVGLREFWRLPDVSDETAF
jgi:hypothetical protein